MDGVSEACPRGAIRQGRGDRRSENRRLPTTWAKHTDDETVEVVAALGEAFGTAHRLGLTDAAITAMLNRDGRRRVGPHTVRSWREPHRANTIAFADVVRLAAVLPEEAARPLVDLLASKAGMVAIDLPELDAGADTIERGGLDVHIQAGELAEAIVSATGDGHVDEHERLAIEREAQDVVRAAGWVGASAARGGG